MAKTSVSRSVAGPTFPEAVCFGVNNLGHSKIYETGAALGLASRGADSEIIESC
jgi:hypothetical protein